MKETIYNYNDLLQMLDSLLREPSQFWDSFYADRSKKIPFFVNSPDENLVSYFESGILKQGKVLELGCGPGRNAIYLAEQGCNVDAVDLSVESLNWARERANEKKVSINFIYQNIFDLEIEKRTYDFVYDSGCFHQIAPHRRMSYITLVNNSLKQNGYFAITCFEQGGEYGGANITDWEVYRQRSLHGGLGYTVEKLREIFKDFKEIEIRKMVEYEQPNHKFGVSGFLTALLQKC
ncbi:class I SAM-dependent methyltransferase [Ureibacillus acetophenoni]|uniref:Methyltransferase family protein n=1 Tax=Ureibacillus acetophenoni TaxID=614649 RepID=A0A285UKQ6_9BACL|nr:class I SAM-dependent methyltransferase [Ureibacillus acetophenoni]SOC42485.1 methyltransferase family protein [Ureibacillus acetophenoni]